LRAIEPDQSMPALIVTGDTEASALEQITSAGVSYINKPVKPPVLARRLKDLLSESAVAMS